MKTLLRNSLKLVTASLLVAGATMIANAQDARLQLDQLDALASRASRTVDVQIDAQTTKLVGVRDRDEARLKDLRNRLKGIYIKVFTFEKEGQYAPAEVDSVVAQLRGPNWTPLVTVKSKTRENTMVYINQAGDQINGLAVLNLEPKEIVVVNIVGPIDLSKLKELGLEGIR